MFFFVGLSHYTLAEASEAQLWPLAISINEFDDGNCVGISVQGSPDIDIRKECLIQRCSYARGNSMEAHLFYPDGFGLHKIRQIHIPTLPPFPTALGSQFRILEAVGRFVVSDFVLGFATCLVFGLMFRHTWASHIDGEECLFLDFAPEGLRNSIPE